MKGFHSRNLGIYNSKVGHLCHTRLAFFYFSMLPQILYKGRYKIHLPMQETWVQSLDWGDPLENEMATHSSILAWEIPWTKEPGELQSMGSQKSWTWLSNSTTTMMRLERKLLKSLHCLSLSVHGKNTNIKYKTQEIN